MYFSKFPLVKYPIKDGDTFRFAYARNLLRRVVLSDGLKSSDSAFIEYNIKDGERPEHIAEKLYGDPTFHWLVLLTNDIIDPYYDWYKSESALQDFIQKKYGNHSVYFTDAGNGFTYSPYIGAGATLTQGNISSPVRDYQPTLCKLIVTNPQFQEGSATITGTNGAPVSVIIHRTEASYIGVHHFQIPRGENDSGASAIATLDPLSQQTGDYSYVGGVIGGTTDVYPGDNSYSPPYTPSGTVDFHETYIGKYMGVVGDKVNTYAVNNYIYEMQKNDEKRTIKLLHPRYKEQAIRELEALLRV